MRRNSLLWVLCATSFILRCTTTQAPSPKTVPVATTSAERGKAVPAYAIQTPPAAKAVALTLPALTRGQLKNGLSTLLIQDAKLPLISVQLSLRVGSIDDPADLSGLAEFTAEMLRQGTARYSADQLSLAADQVGLDLAVQSGYEFTTIKCSGRREYASLCVTLLAELAMRPTFPKNELAEVRDKFIGSIKDLFDQPSALASVHLQNLLYGDEHPAGQSPSVAAIEKISTKTLKQFHRRFYTPQQSLLAVSGDFDAAVLPQMLTSIFGKWRSQTAVNRVLPPVKPTATGLQILLVDKPDLSQSFIALGHEGIGVRDPQRDAAQVMNYVLGGGGFSSRLMQVVRSEGGKTYSINSDFESATDQGLFTVETFTRTAETVATLQLIQRELMRIRSAPPAAAELSEAKGRLTGGYPIGFQTAERYTGALVEAQLRGLPDSFITEYPLRVERLTTAMLADVAKSLIHPDRLQAVIVGQAAQLGPLLKKAGLSFEQIAYTDPFSKKARALAAQSHASPSDASPRDPQAVAILERALKAAGGAAAFAAVNTVSATGLVKMGSGSNVMTGQYQFVMAPPDRIRFSILSDQMTVVMASAGQSGFAQLQKNPAQSLPPQKVSELQAERWREPVLLIHRALQPDVKLKLVVATGQSVPPGHVAVEATPPKLPGCTLIFEQRSAKLVGLHYRSTQGRTYSVALAGHKRVGPLRQVPHQIDLVGGPAPQHIQFSKIELNTPVTDAAFVLPK